MMPPELQPRSFRPYISSSISAPSFSSSFNKNNGSTSPFSSPDSNPNQRFPTTSSSRSLKNSRFSATSFAYNARIAIALIPCAAFLLDLGGTAVLATLTVGLMVSYILDSLNFKPAAFFSVWLSLLFSQFAFFFSATASLRQSFNSLPLTLLSAFLCAQSNFLIGVWSSLQFKWIQIENPSIVLALERLLFASVPFAAASLFTWATVSAVGMSNAAYYLMAFNCIFYWLYSIPRISSFASKNDAKYHGGELYASTRGALWWITKNPNQLHSIRVVNGAVALVVVVICLEFRVVFHSFGRYIHVPAPLSYLLVTVTMLGGASGAAAYAVR
nr:hypothetical protein CFP56_18219 [Quercus suber]